MTDPARISELMLENVFAVFNVRDPEQRAEAIARNYTEDVTWTDPDATSQGREALNERAQKLLDRLPGFVFTVAGPVYVSGIWVFSPSIWTCRSSRPQSAGST